MENDLIKYLRKRLLDLRKRKLINIFYAVRNKNQGRIEELEDIINRIETGNFEYPEPRRRTS